MAGDDASLSDRCRCRGVLHDADLEVAVLVRCDDGVTAGRLPGERAGTSSGGRQGHAGADVVVVLECSLDHALAGVVVVGRVLLVQHDDVGVGADRRQVGVREVGVGVGRHLKGPPRSRRRCTARQHQESTAQQLVACAGRRSERQRVVERDRRRGARGVGDDEAFLGLTGGCVDDPDLEPEVTAAAPVGEHVRADRCGQRRGQSEARRGRTGSDRADSTKAGGERCGSASSPRCNGGRADDVPRLRDDVVPVEDRGGHDLEHERVSAHVRTEIRCEAHGGAVGVRCGRRGHPHLAVDDLFKVVGH